MAVAFMLAYPYGTVRLMSSYNFSEDNIDRGPPTDENEKILPVTVNGTTECVNGWICEHRWKPIVEMINFRINVNGTSMTKRKIFDSDTVAFCREDRGFIVFTNSNFSSLAGKRIFVCVPKGKYCDVIMGYNENGNCLNVVEVDNRRAILFKPGDDNNNGVVAFHIGSRID